MKKIAILISVCLFSLFSFAQDAKNAGADYKMKDRHEKYCAKLVDGKVTMMLDSKELIVDVTLENGTVVKTDGTIVKKDGTQMVLINGECVNHDGELIKKEQKKAAGK